MEIFLGAALGTMIGLLLAFPAIILEIRLNKKQTALLFIAALAYKCARKCTQWK